MEKEDGQNFDEWFEEYRKIEMKSVGEVTESYKKTILAQKDAIKRVRKVEYNGDFSNSVTYYVDNGEYIHFITAYGDVAGYQTTFDQILSTFEFMD